MTSLFADAVTKENEPLATYQATVMDAVAKNEYLQGNYFSALVEFEIAKRYRQVPTTNEYAQLELELLAYFGMHEQAYQVLLEQNLIPSLAQENSSTLQQLVVELFAQGHDQLTFQLLDRLRKNVPQLFNSQLQYIAVQLNLRANELSQAKQQLSLFKEHDTYFFASHFSLAQHLLSRNKQAAIEHLSYISARLNANDPKLLAALADKANVLLAFTYLQSEEYALAKSAFSRVGLDGRESQLALLGLGWLHFQQQDLATAITIWQTLLNQPDDSAYKREAYVAIAYAFEQLNMPEQSIHAYQSSLDYFSQQQRFIDETLIKVTEPSFLPTMYDFHPIIAAKVASYQPIKGLGFDIILSPHLGIAEPVRAPEFSKHLAQINELKNMLRYLQSLQHQLAQLAVRIYQHGGLPSPSLERSFRHDYLQALRQSALQMSQEKTVDKTSLNNIKGLIAEIRQQSKTPLNDIAMQINAKTQQLQQRLVEQQLAATGLLTNSLNQQKKELNYYQQYASMALLQLQQAQLIGDHQAPGSLGQKNTVVSE
ncbi:hypothetical protein [Thalassotalea aquiviva]|uniref:tetratricopeptide repeat protein n=1 Tax=Thalassotalea aquiviva TaxID=3242415 RepID=UPI00352A8CB8